MGQWAGWDGQLPGLEEELRLTVPGEGEQMVSARFTPADAVGTRDETLFVFSITKRVSRRRNRSDDCVEPTRALESKRNENGRRVRRAWL